MFLLDCGHKKYQITNVCDAARRRSNPKAGSTIFLPMGDINSSQYRGDFGRHLPTWMKDCHQRVNITRYVGLSCKVCTDIAEFNANFDFSADLDLGDTEH